MLLDLPHPAMQKKKITLNYPKSAAMGFFPSDSITSVKQLPYFFGYKTDYFSFQNNPKDLDPSFKTDLDLWDCFRKGKIGIMAKFHRTDLVT